MTSFPDKISRSLSQGLQYCGIWTGNRDLSPEKHYICFAGTLEDCLRLFGFFKKYLSKYLKARGFTVGLAFGDITPRSLESLQDLRCFPYRPSRNLLRSFTMNTMRGTSKSSGCSGSMRPSSQPCSRKRADLRLLTKASFGPKYAVFCPENGSTRGFRTRIDDCCPEIILQTPNRRGRCRGCRRGGRIRAGR